MDANAKEDLERIKQQLRKKSKHNKENHYVPTPAEIVERKHEIRLEHRVEQLEDLVKNISERLRKLEGEDDE